MKNTLKEQLKRLEALERKSDRAMEVYEADPENKEKEECFDRWYKREFDQYIELAESIVKFTGGKIDFNTAKKMIKTQRNELIALLS